MSDQQPPTEQQLEWIELRCAEASPGPWVAEIYDTLREAKKDGFFQWARGKKTYPGEVGHVLRYTPEPDGGFGMTGLPGVVEVSGADARFIAHARSDVPVLLAEVRRLRTLLAQNGVAF